MDKKKFRAQVELELAEQWVAAQGLNLKARGAAGKKAKKFLDKCLTAMGKVEITKKEIEAGRTAQIFGNHEAAWLAFYQFLLVEVELDCCKPLQGLMEMAEVCGWWTPMQDVAIFQDRPLHVKQDAGNRAHCQDGMAIQYRDGWGLYAWHGMRVQEKYIMDPVTVEWIKEEKNAELRRVLIARYGMTNYMRDVGAKLLHTDDWGDLYEVERGQGLEKALMIKVVNSTKEPDGTYKEYVLRCHPQLRPIHQNGTFGEPQALTARNAVASIQGLRGEEYKPVQQT